MMPHGCISLVNRFHETIDDVLLVESGSADSGSESIAIGRIVKRGEAGLAAPFIDTLVPVSATSATAAVRTCLQCCPPHPVRKEGIFKVKSMGNRRKWCLLPRMPVLVTTAHP